MTFNYMSLQDLQRCDRAQSLTSWLPQPEKFMGWKVHLHACKQYIFHSYNKSYYNIVRFGENHFMRKSYNKSDYNIVFFGENHFMR